MALPRAKAIALIDKVSLGYFIIRGCPSAFMGKIFIHRAVLFSENAVNHRF
jgi:hypothetical protein